MPSIPPTSPAIPPTEVIASAPDHVSRAPSDVLRLGVAVVAFVAVLLIGVLFDEAVTRFVAELVSGASALPSWFVTALVLVGQVLTVAVVGGGLVVAVVRRRWILLASAAVAALVASALFVLLRPLADQQAAQAADVDLDLSLVPPDEVVSAASVAVLAAVVTAAAPWVSRRWRRLGWAAVLIAAALRFLGAPIAFDTILAVLAGWVAGAAATVVVGAPSRRPSGTAIAAGLAAVGVELARLEQASVDARGSTPYFATTADGDALFVKALGDDERSADVMFRIYRRLQPRDLGDEKSFSTLRRAVEHEALVALAARDLGVQTPRLAGFATAEPNGFVLAYEAIAGRSLDRLSPDELTDEVLDGVWTQLALLRRHRIAHRDLRLANVFLADDGVAWIIDFGFSELAASDLLLATDVAELLASSTTTVGVERAVAVAERLVGADAVRSSIPRLQLPMLSGATRTALKGDPGTLEALVARAGRSTADGAGAI